MLSCFLFLITVFNFYGWLRFLTSELWHSPECCNLAWPWYPYTTTSPFARLQAKHFRRFELPVVHGKLERCKSSYLAHLGDGVFSMRSRFRAQTTDHLKSSLWKVTWLFSILSRYRGFGISLRTLDRRHSLTATLLPTWLRHVSANFLRLVIETGPCIIDFHC